MSNNFPSIYYTYSQFAKLPFSPPPTPLLPEECAATDRVNQDSNRDRDVHDIIIFLLRHFCNSSYSSSVMVETGDAARAVPPPFTPSSSLLLLGDYPVPVTVVSIAASEAPQLRPFFIVIVILLLLNIAVLGVRRPEDEEERSSSFSYRTCYCYCCCLCHRYLLSSGWGLRP